MSLRTVTIDVHDGAEQREGTDFPEEYVMVRIWECQSGEKIRLSDNTGKKYIGKIVAIFDADETNDDKDGITVDVKGDYIGFFANEISEIERV